MSSAHQAAYLPPLVRELVCFDRSTSALLTATVATTASATSSSSSSSLFSGTAPPQYLNAQGLVSTESIQSVLPQVVFVRGAVTTLIDPLDLQAFKDACFEVFSELRKLESSLQELGDEGENRLVKMFAEQLDWMSGQDGLDGAVGKRAGEIWLDLFHQGHYDQAWLVGSTVLEQMISNIIFTIQGSDKFIPFLVRDLLAVSCLTKCVDPVLTMMGSPLTLNIRNLLWHGFIIPSDSIPLDAYGAMLIVTTMTIAKGAMSKLATPLLVRYQDPKSYYFKKLQPPRQEEEEEEDERSQEMLFDAMFELIAYGTPPPRTDTSHVIKILQFLVKSSSFVVSGTENQWMSACKYLEPSLMDSSYSRSFLFVMLTLPLMEHALRLVYVTVNRCKEDRKHALIAGEYYLTLDVMLDPVVPVEYYDPASPMLDGQDPESLPNQLYRELGPQVMNLLNDLFIMTHGPRLRDRTSHGELNSHLDKDISVDPWFRYYIGLIIFLLKKYVVMYIAEGLSDHIETHTSWIQDYAVSRFDSWAMLRKEMARCQMMFRDYSRFHVANITLANDENASDAEPAIEIVLLDKNAAIFLTTDAFSPNMTVEQLVQTSLSTWTTLEASHSADTTTAPVSEFATNLPAWILILQNVQVAIQRVTSKVQTATRQLALRQLSSRPRKQFETMRPMVPRFLGMLLGCLALVQKFIMTSESSLMYQSIQATRESRLTVNPTTERAYPLDKSSTTTARSITSSDKSSAADIALRLKLTTFLDKFVSSFDKAKFNLIEPAWEDLTKGIRALEEQLQGFRVRAEEAEVLAR
ncbi:hypothetical protein EDD11_008215 [Mortierella claussenii]|nr:hypothetical protein EDD11_008215 [Mortierella claussenii]